MRVIAGTAGSLPLKSPKGLDTRPTTDRIKETLFNILMPYLPGAVFVDLFSGGGSIGIEALSRGARKAYFVENAPKAIFCIQENLSFTKFTDHAVVLKQDAGTSLHQIHEEQADLIFMDPPYGLGLVEPVLRGLAQMKYVTKETLIIVEVHLDAELSYLSELGLAFIKEKIYKTNKHIFIKRKGQDEESCISGKF